MDVTPPQTKYVELNPLILLIFLFVHGIVAPNEGGTIPSVWELQCDFSIWEYFKIKAPSLVNETVGIIKFNYFYSIAWHGLKPIKPPCKKIPCVMDGSS